MNAPQPSWLSPFRDERGTCWGLLAVFASVNALVAINAFLHDPTIGYDAGEHLLYIETLSEFHLPGPEKTLEFFSPPLPYLAPALARSSGVVSLWGAGKFAQMLNVLYSLGLTFYLLKLCELCRPGSVLLRISALGLLGMLPVYYKTLALVRGVPMLAFLVVLALHQAAGIFIGRSLGRKDAIGLGIVLGLVVLARQWGFFLFPAIILFVLLQVVRESSHRLACLKSLAIALGVSFIVGAWFYLCLYFQYGSFAAFNRPPSPRFSISNQPRGFYYGLGLDRLFKDPVRTGFPNQLIPKFYSELWGDYECYWVVYGWLTKERRFDEGVWLQQKLAASSPIYGLETNRHEMGAYLGRVNLVSLVPSCVLFLGLLLGCIHFVRFLARRTNGDAVGVCSLLFLVVMASAAGYMWFLVRYPDPGKGDTIKATYLLQVYPFMALWGGLFLLKMKESWPRVGRVLIVLLAGVFLHNLPACVTRYVPAWLP